MKSIKILAVVAFYVATILLSIDLNAQLNLPRGSQKASVSQTVGTSKIHIKYSRPSVNDREVWGNLVPYGMNNLGFGTATESPWRAGANENTIIKFSDDVKIEGQAISAGKYGLHIIVNEDDFWITDLGPLRFVNFDFFGNIKYTWLVPAGLPDGYLEVHSFTVDPDGNLYGGDNQYGRTQKFIPKPDADPELLIEPPWFAQ